MGQCTPPPAKPEEDGSQSKRRMCDFVQMGFPSQRTDDVPSLVHAGSSRGGSSDAHRALLVRTGYVCPRCRAKTSELPADCAVCGLKLVLAPHLARSFHHLFPVPPFAEVAQEVDVAVVNDVNGNGGQSADIIGSAPPSCVASDADVTSSNPIFEIVSSSGSGTGISRSGERNGPNDTTVLRTVKVDAKLLVSSTECDRCCFGCLKVIGVHKSTAAVEGGGDAAKAANNASSSSAKSKKRKAPAPASVVEDPNAPRPEPLRFQCPDCKNLFCADCDAYLHETLHNCPGCLCAPPL